MKQWNLIPVLLVLACSPTKSPRSASGEAKPAVESHQKGEPPAASADATAPAVPARSTDPTAATDAPGAPEVADGTGSGREAAAPGCVDSVHVEEALPLRCPAGTAQATLEDSAHHLIVVCQRPDKVRHGPWLHVWRYERQMIETGVMENGKKSGPYCKVRENGGIMLKTVYLDDQPHGQWLAEWDNGQKMETATYDHGILEGPFSAWYENGTLRERTAYRKGLRHGVYESWYENGRPKQSGGFVDGRPDGTFRTWSEKGRPVGVVAVWERGRVVRVRRVGR